MSTARYRHVGRVLMETRSPLSITVGKPDGIFDDQLVRDANGLPAIPGTSIAGVLRTLMRREYDHAAASALLGSAPDDDTDRASPLWIDWGVLVDSTGTPAEGLLFQSDDGRRQLDEDPVLSLLADTSDTPLFRDRVRIGHRGVAAEAGKFDRPVAPVGCRFLIAFELPSDMASDPRWQQLASLLEHPLLRLGGWVRSGLGNMTCVCAHHRCFDLRDDASASAYRALGSTIMTTRAFETWSLPAPQLHELSHIQIDLEPQDTWRVGAGEDAALSSDADRKPLVERRIVWPDAQPAFFAEPALVIPGASIKGCLLHRAVFLYRCQIGDFAEHQAPSNDSLVPAEIPLPTVFEHLFGFVYDKTARAAALFVDDARLALDEASLFSMTHNSIDRFTGGVRDRVLFEEQVAFRGRLTVNVWIDYQRLGTDDAEAVRALNDALDELVSGQLPIGGGIAKGHGAMGGRVFLNDTPPSWTSADQSQAI